MKKPKILRAGDTVALVSLSSGVAGESNIQRLNIKTTIVAPGGIRTNFVGGNGVFGEQMEVYRATETGKIISMMKGEVPGLDMAAYQKMIVGDLKKMAHQIIKCAEQEVTPLRMVLGSDAYKKIHASLLEKLTSLEEQKELAYSTDAEDLLK